MKKLKRGLIWFLLLSKRVWKRPAFLALLVLIPLLTVGYKTLAKGDSGVMTVAYSCGDEAAWEAVGELEAGSDMIRFVRCETSERAEELVRLGKADAAWIFPAELRARTAQFAATLKPEDAVVRVVQREENVALRLAREKLSAILMRLCARELYIGYVREKLPDLAALSDGELLEYYDDAFVADTLFTIDSGEVSKEASGYLLSPVRGLLGVLTVIAGAATAMYHFRDCETGTFAQVPLTRRPLVEWAMQLVSAVNVSAAVLLALWLSGLWAGPARELALLALNVLSVAGFSMLLRRLCGSLKTLGTALVLLVVVEIAVCPVFFDMVSVRTFQYLFPTTYYINGAFNERMLGWGLVYTAILYALCALLDLRHKQV